MPKLSINQPTTSDQLNLANFYKTNWGHTSMICHGKRYNLLELPTFIAKDSLGTLAGILTFAKHDTEWEIISLDAIHQYQGVGTQLLDHLKKLVIDAKIAQISLITSNDNLDALRFYQRRGFRMVSIHHDAITEARKMKPTIPLIGEYKIPIYDEIKLVWKVNPSIY